MVTIGYKILLTINVLHEYYTDWQSRDTIIVPTKATQEALKNYQLLFKSTALGGVILARITDEEGTLQVPITDTEKFRLTFYLRSTSNYFYNRTNLPIKPTKVTNIVPNRGGYYFNNLGKESGNIFKPTGSPSNFNNLKHLSKKTEEGISTHDEVILMPSIFRLKFTADKSSFSINIKDKSGVDIVPITVIENTTPFKEYEITLAKNLPSDFYKIIIDEGDPQSVYLSNEFFHDAPFGLIEIFYPTDLPSYSFLKINASLIQIKEGADYYLWFKNQKLKWRYVYQGTPPISIKLNGAASNFSKMGKIFESPSPLDIRESYLTVKDNSGKNLPNPNGKTLKAAFNGNVFSHYFAEIHV